MLIYSCIELNIVAAWIINTMYAAFAVFNVHKYRNLKPNRLSCNLWGETHLRPDETQAISMTSNELSSTSSLPRYKGSITTSHSQLNSAMMWLCDGKRPFDTIRNIHGGRFSFNLWPSKQTHDVTPEKKVRWQIQWAWKKEIVSEKGRKCAAHKSPLLYLPCEPSRLLFVVAIMRY